MTCLAGDRQPSKLKRKAPTNGPYRYLVWISNTANISHDLQQLYLFHYSTTHLDGLAPEDKRLEYNLPIHMPQGYLEQSPDNQETTRQVQRKQA